MALIGGVDVENIDAAYYQKLKFLEDHLNGAVNDKKAYELLQAYAQRYLSPWTLWEKLFDMANEHGASDYELTYFQKLADFHMFYPRKSEKMLEDSFYLKKKLYFNSRDETIDEFSRQLRDRKKLFKTDYNILIQNLQYPHCDLDRIWERYEFHSYFNPSKAITQTYKKMTALYAKIVSAEENGNDKE